MKITQIIYVTLGVVALVLVSPTQPRVEKPATDAGDVSTQVYWFPSVLESLEAYTSAASVAVEVDQPKNEATAPVMPKVDDPPAPPPPAPPPPAPVVQPAPPPPDISFREVALPSASKVAGLELTPDQKVSSKKRFVLLSAKTDRPDAAVHWIVLGSVPDAPPSALTAGNGHTLQLFPNDQNDLIVVMAYADADGHATETAITKILVEGPAPPATSPSPTAKVTAPVGPQPLTGPLHVTMIIDYSQQTPEVAALRASQALRDTLTKLDCKTHELSYAQAPDDMAKAIKEAGGPPVVIVQDANGDIVAKAKIVNADGVLTLVRDLREGK